MMGVLGIINLFFAIVIGLYFWNLLRSQQTSKTAVDRESRKEMDKLQRLNAISLNSAIGGKDSSYMF
jgi:Lon-like ATP-dependent protease